MDAPDFNSHIKIVILFISLSVSVEVKIIGSKGKDSFIFVDRVCPSFILSSDFIKILKINLIEGKTDKILFWFWEWKNWVCALILLLRHEWELKKRFLQRRRWYSFVVVLFFSESKISVEINFNKCLILKLFLTDYLLSEFY